MKAYVRVPESAEDFSNINVIKRLLIVYSGKAWMVGSIQMNNIFLRSKVKILYFRKRKVLIFRLFYLKSGKLF